jgi:hypothetical protein
MIDDHMFQADSSHPPSQIMMGHTSGHRKFITDSLAIFLMRTSFSTEFFEVVIPVFQ